MRRDDYFDMRNILSPPGPACHCPIAGCISALGTTHSQWGEMPYCPAHRIRIHAGSRTFVYYNGDSLESRRAAALRNIVFEPDYFEKHFLGHAHKAESHRFGFETSEDALTWNVFSRLASANMLAPLLSNMMETQHDNEPELYLWGLRFNTRESATPEVFSALRHAQRKFEPEIRHFLTEPDVMLYVPGKILAIIEAKFTSGNTVAAASATSDIAGEKPKSRQGILNRYAMTNPSRDSLRTPPDSDPFYAQLYRNLVFAIFMARELGVPWMLLNLVSAGRFGVHKRNAAFRDPSPFIRAVLPHNAGHRFKFYNWEQLYADRVAPFVELRDLSEYMKDKSANGVRAFSI